MAEPVRANPPWRTHGHWRRPCRTAVEAARSAADTVLQHRLLLLLPLRPQIDGDDEPRDAGPRLPACVREPAPRSTARGGMAWRRTPGRAARVVRGRARAYGEAAPGRAAAQALLSDQRTAGERGLGAFLCSHGSKSRPQHRWPGRAPRCQPANTRRAWNTRAGDARGPPAARSGRRVSRDHGAD